MVMEETNGIEELLPYLFISEYERSLVKGKEKRHRQWEDTVTLSLCRLTRIYRLSLSIT